MFSDEVASDLRPSCKEATANSFVEGRFGGEASGGMKEGCEGRKRGLMVGAVCLMQP